MYDANTTRGWFFLIIFAGLLPFANVYVFSDQPAEGIKWVVIVIGIITAILGILTLFEIRSNKALLDADVKDDGIGTLFGKSFDAQYSKYMKKLKEGYSYSRLTAEANRAMVDWAIQGAVSDALSYRQASTNQSTFDDAFYSLIEKENVTSDILSLIELQSNKHTAIVDAHWQFPNYSSNSPLYNGNQQYRPVSVIGDIHQAKKAGDQRIVQEYVKYDYDIDTGLNKKDKHYDIKTFAYKLRVKVAKLAHEAFVTASK